MMNKQTKLILCETEQEYRQYERYIAFIAKSEPVKAAITKREENYTTQLASTEEIEALPPILGFE